MDKPTVDFAMDLFSTEGPVLTQPECMIIFTVPTALLYSGQYNVIMQNFSKQFGLPNFKIKEKTGERNEVAWTRMREIVERRLERQLIEAKALDHAVEMSGGVVRELVRVIPGAAIKALVAKANSIKLDHVERAVDKLRAEYGYSLTREDYIQNLKKVHETNPLLATKDKPMLDLLHNLFILNYPDGPGWYGVNPIVHKPYGV